METAQLLLVFLLVWCEDTESLLHKPAKLGENMTLDCQIGVKDIYWVFQKLSDSPVLILRTFSSDSTAACILEERLKDKYSSLTLSRLFISNITRDELGIYYCAKTGTPLQLSNGTRVYITESATDNNQTEFKPEKLSPVNENPVNINKMLTVTSFLLNAVLIAIIGLLMLRHTKQKSRQQCQNVDQEPPEDSCTAQYSEISEYSRRESPCQTNGTYVLLQKPNPHPR